MPGLEGFRSGMTARLVAGGLGSEPLHSQSETHRYGGVDVL